MLKFIKDEKYVCFLGQMEIICVLENKFVLLVVFFNLQICKKEFKDNKGIDFYGIS